jgi:hypothetical protein
MGDPTRRPPSNGLAIASMLIGIVAVVAVLTILGAFVAFVPGVVAILLGIFALGNAKRQPPGGPGRAQSILGIVTGAVATLASVAAYAIVALFVASSDVAVVDTEVASPDDFQLSDRSCRVDGALAVAGGILTNTSDVEHGFVITVSFTDGDRQLGRSSDELEADLSPDATWDWEVAVSVDEQVGTEGLECRVDRVETGRVVED